MNKHLEVRSFLGKVNSRSIAFSDNRSKTFRDPISEGVRGERTLVGRTLADQGAPLCHLLR